MKNRPDPFKLARFLEAQEGGVFERALQEIKEGRKQTHWMWFIFPQHEALGMSDTSRYYGLSCLEEARAYLEHPILGPRLRDVALAALEAPGNAREIFGHPDDLKLRSSATLFAAADQPSSVFEMLIKKFFDGERDQRTLQVLADSM